MISSDEYTCNYEHVRWAESPKKVLSKDAGIDTGFSTHQFSSAVILWRLYPERRSRKALQLAQP